MPAHYLMADASSYDKPQIQIKPLDAKTVEGDTVLKDIYGKPILLLRVTQQRQIYQQGQKSLIYFMVALVAAGLFFAAVILLLLEKQVLSRLLVLHKSISRIRESADVTLRVPVKGNDELSSLTHEINKMLEAQEQTEKMLKVFSLTDELTGLYNRRGFLSLAEQQLKIAERMNREMLLLYGDLNNLKTINDTYGHLQGDRALIDTAKIFKETFRESDIIARIGGDEFAVLTEKKEDSNTEVLTCRLKQNIDSRNEKGDRPYTIGISIGIFISDPKRSYTVEQIIAEADANMYDQKREKQNN
jgi:diguanylate cyclase (GGDEF)-like protein